MKISRVLFVNKIKLSGYNFSNDLGSEVKLVDATMSKVKSIDAETQFLKIVDDRDGITMVPYLNVSCIFASEASVKEAVVIINSKK